MLHLQMSAFDRVRVCVQALEKFTIEKDIAAYIKKEFDKKHNPTWHCIVGRNFGAHKLPLLIRQSGPTARLLMAGSPHDDAQAAHILHPYACRATRHPL